MLQSHVALHRAWRVDAPNCQSFKGHICLSSVRQEVRDLLMQGKQIVKR